MRTIGPVVALAVATVFASGCRVGVSADLTGGNRAFAAGHFEPALERYRRAERARPHDPTALFGAGAALYRLQRYDESADASGAAATRLTDPGNHARALHNLGNALAGTGRLEEALDAYRQALRLEDRENTRLNYLLLRRRLGGSETPKQGQGAATGPAAGQELFGVARQFDAPPSRPKPRDASGHPNSDW